ncbi:ATP-binding protein [Streptomyces chengbuensis]|uniref:ATP-binding protein n=1 Tax=Streptomyces sp. NPDC019208 TaxID=3154683 RepID=UPI0025B38D71|nr:ATP-binding protein [Streptomyces sp. HUAS CB01]WJY54978.1 ATP-binding protein [Streptomyces sp. HUAS CB01]
MIGTGHGAAAAWAGNAWAGAVYDGGPGSIAEARRFSAQFLVDRHGFDPASEAVGAVQLIVSELVTNACKYAHGPCALDLERIPSGVEITVWDSSTALPLARAADPGRVGQHGLEIVLALCEGFTVQREPVGKRITVRVSCT